MQTGQTAVTLYGTAGSEPSGVLANVQDQSDEITCGTAESVSRSTNGWKEKAPTILDATAELTLTWTGADTGLQAIQAACVNGTLIAMGFIDNTVLLGGIGWWADCVVSGFSPDQPLEDGMTVPVSFKAAGAITLLP